MLRAVMRFSRDLWVAAMEGEGVEKGFLDVVMVVQGIVDDMEIMDRV